MEGAKLREGGGFAVPHCHSVVNVETAPQCKDYCGGKQLRRFPQVMFSSSSDVITFLLHLLIRPIVT